MAPSTIIVVHRIPGKLPASLEAIRAFTGRENELFVVDASADDPRCVSPAKTADGSIGRPYVVSAPGAESLAKTCNTLLKKCRYSQVVFLDSTARVANGWLQALGACLNAAPRAGFAGPLADEHYAGLPRQVCRPAGSLNAALQSRHRDRRIAVHNPGVLCLGGRLSTVRELDCLDETCEDIDVALADLCLRAEMAGYQNYLAGDIYIAADKQSVSQRWQKALRDRWESLDPASDRRKHFAALDFCRRANRTHRSGNSDAAIDLFLKGIGVYPAERRLYLDLAAALTEIGRYADALQALGEMPDADGSREAQLLVGTCQRGLGQAAAAERTAAGILAIDGQSAAGWWLKGVCLADRKMADEARTALEQSIACDPGHGPAYTALGHLAENRGEREQALKDLERGFALCPDDSAAAAYHTAVSRQKAYARAIPFFTQALAVQPSSRRLHYLLIDLLLKAGEQRKAMAVIESMLVAFGVEKGLLQAALAVRAQLGLRTVAASGGKIPTLAFCLIVKNEERDLPRCLQSIKPVADEIVVADTGSRDSTRDVARVFGARVFDFEWCDDFAAAKNFAAARAEADWIFSIDADEVLSVQDYEALRALIRNGSDAPVAYAVTTRNYLKVADVIGWQPNDGCYPEEAGLGWMPSEKVRLFPNTPEVRFSYPVHEMVEPSLEKAGIPVVSCDIPVHHYGKLDRARSLSKGETYFKIGLKKLSDMAQSVTGIRELAIQAQTLGDYPEAARLWEHLLTLDPEQVQAHINLASTYLESGHYAKSLEAARQACRLDPTLKESQFNLAMSLLHTGDARGAVGVLEKLVDRHPEYPAARFVLAAAYSCVEEDRNAAALLDELQRSSLGAGMPEALRHLASRLNKAGYQEYRRRILKLAG
jgi:tetratricopeptide (TPR) repeat protein